MTARLPFRLAAIILVLFAAGHTYGFLAFTPPTPASLAVRQAMNTVPMQVGNSTFTYGGFYRGFGLFVTAYLMFSALVAWQLGAMHELGRNFRMLAGGLIAVQTMSFALSWKYFSILPALFSAIVVALLAWGVAAGSRQHAQLRH